MGIRKISILLPLFIIGIMTQVWADSVKSINNPVNQETIMKMDENKGALQKKKSRAKEAVKSSKKSQVGSQFGIQQTDNGFMTSRSKLDINFLKAVKAEKKSLLIDFLDKVIFSYDFAQKGWRNHFPSFKEVAEAKSSDPDVSQSLLRSYPTESRHFEEGRILETFKLLQFKRKDISKEIFMGFRFSFNPMRGHLFLEMNAIPSEKGPGLIIPF
jgi:hypothetical protein